MKLKTNWHFTKWDSLDILFVVQYIRCFTNFEALQIFFYNFLLKWGKMKKNLSPEDSLKLKNIILFLNRSLIFFQMVIFATLFRRCPTLWKSTLKMTMLFWLCLAFSIQRWNTQRCLNVAERCKFQRWRTQRCFNVDLTLLKFLLGIGKSWLS